MLLAGRRGGGYKTQGALGGVGSLKDDEFMDENVKEETLVELNQKRQDLLAELKGYERNTRALYNAGVGGETETTGTIPKDTKVNSSLEMNPEEGCGEVVLSTNNDTVIKAAILFSEEIFDEEARFVYFPNPQRVAKVAIKPKDSAARRCHQSSGIVAHQLDVPRVRGRLSSAGSACTCRSRRCRRYRRRPCKCASQSGW